jgi:hypothetical protein
LVLVTTDPATIHLEVIAPHRAVKQRGLQDKVLDVLAGGQVLTGAKQRDCLGIKNERLGEVLELLKRAGQLSCTAPAWKWAWPS